VIGTGSSGIQSIPLIAEQASKLTVFQRTPSFSVSNGNLPLSPERVAELKRDIRKIREICRWSTIGQPYDWLAQGALSVTPEERRARLEADWQKGGFEWMFGSNNDLLTSDRANEFAAEFVREKIREIVKDPEVAKRLMPTGYPIATKRLPLDNGYFQTFNRDNVALVDLRETPIECIVESGIKTSEQLHELDAIVFATGFDALTGPLLRLGLRGRGGNRLESKWAAGPEPILEFAPAVFRICLWSPVLVAHRCLAICLCQSSSMWTGSAKPLNICEATACKRWSPQPRRSVNGGRT
jgi:cyclohexanone monooxygenase